MRGPDMDRQSQTASMDHDLPSDVVTEQVPYERLVGESSKQAVVGKVSEKVSGNMLSERSESLPVVRLRGLAFHAISEQQCIEAICRDLADGRGGWVITANLDHLRRALVDPSYRALCDEADLLVADGMPLVWASRIQGTPLPQRVAGSSLVSTLSQQAASEARSIYLLGGDPGTAEAAGEVLKTRYGGLRIAGSFCPPFGFEKDESQVCKMIETLVHAQPDIVYVALGSPKQELLIARIREHLPQAWWIGVGISFSFLTGDVRRAPRWMQVTGLEWVHRLVQEPRRLARRYLIEGVPFAITLLLSAAWTRIAGRG